MARPSLSNLFLVVGLVLVGLAAYQYAGHRTGPALVAAQTDIQIADVEPGEETEVVIGLENLSSNPIRVVGLGEC